MLFLPRNMHSEWSVTTEMFLMDRYFLGIKPAECITLPKKHQHTCLKSKGQHGSGTLDLQITSAVPTELPTQGIERLYLRVRRVEPWHDLFRTQ